MNDLRKATASLLAVSDSDETTAAEPQITMSLAYFNSLLYKIAQADGYEGTQSEFAAAFAKALNGGNAVIESANGADNFPETGEEGALYLDTETGKIYYYENGEYKQANADTEITEDKISEMVEAILSNNPDETNKAIVEAVENYLDDNKDEIIDNTINSYLEENKSDIVDDVEIYLNNNKNVVEDGITNYLNNSEEINNIIKDEISDNPEILKNGIEDYAKNNEEMISNTIESYLSENNEIVKDGIKDYFDENKDELKGIVSEHYEAEAIEGLTDEQIIEKVLEDKKPIEGNVFIIKHPICDGKYDYSSYYYDGENWCATSGNYNAENVYFSQDFIVTKQIGALKDFTGKTTLSAKGKNLVQLLESLFANEREPQVKMPSITIINSTAKNYEVGTIIKPTWIAKFNPGEYEFNESTGVELKKWNITNSITNEKSTSASGKFAEIEVTDDMNLTITAEATYSAGIIPLSNLDKPIEGARIESGSVSKTSAALKGYRKTFFGVLYEDIEITQESIRDLNSSNSGMKDGSFFSINVGAGATKVVIAYPANLGDISSVKKDGKYEIADKFELIKMDIEGANGYNAIEYKVYVRTFDKENEEDCVYNVII